MCCLCAVCVFERERKRDTKRDRVCAWVSQAIVPENLTWTQDILKTFTQQWPDKQYAVIRNKAQACVCKYLQNVIFKYFQISAFTCDNHYIALYSNVSLLTVSSPHEHAWTIWVLFIATCHLSWILQSFSNWRADVAWFHKTEHIM